METKGRRAPRTGGLIAAPAETEKTVETSVVEAATSTQPTKPAEIAGEMKQPEERPVNHAIAPAVSEPPASVGTIAATTNRLSAEGPAEIGHNALAVLAESQAALARGLEALSAEMAGLALSGIDTAARTATRMLGVKTISDAIEVNAGFTCSSLDALVGGSAKLSELGVRLATETSEPFLTQFGKNWTKASGRGG